MQYEVAITHVEGAGCAVVEKPLPCTSELHFHVGP